MTDTETYSCVRTVLAGEGWRSGALGPLLGSGGEHVAVAGALVEPGARARGHAVALLAAHPAGPHARAACARVRGTAASHAALAGAEPCPQIHARPASHITPGREQGSDT
jgi:hypothetical protein